MLTTIFSRLSFPRLTIIIFLALLGCNKEDPNAAGVKHFYFEFVDTIESDYSLELLDAVAKILVESDYLISEESAEAGWPFYGSVKRGKKVLKTDMMPPHTNVNRLSPIANLKTYNQGEHTMKAVFTIRIVENQRIIITKESFEWVDDSWRQFSKKLDSEFDMNAESKNDLFNRIAKTLIRYTFK